MEQNEKIVALSFVIAGLLTWFVMGRFFAEMMNIFNIRDPLWDTAMPLSSLLGMAFGGGLMLYFFKSEKIKTFGLNVVAELKRVTWPTMEEVRAATIVTIILVAIITILLGLFDYIWAGITSLIYGL